MNWNPASHTDVQNSANVVNSKRIAYETALNDYNTAAAALATKQATLDAAKLALNAAVTTCVTTVQTIAVP